MQQGVQCGVLRADMELPLVEANQVAALGRLTDSFEELLECWGLLQERGLELLSFSSVLTNDLTNLGVPGSVEERVNALCSGRAATPLPRFRCYTSPCSTDYLFTMSGAHRFGPLGPTPFG